MALIKIFFVISVFASIANAQQIRLFYNYDFGTRGFQHVSRITTSCETLPQRYWNQVSSIKNDRCVMLYSHAECQGRAFRLEAGSHGRLPYFNDDTDSFRACDDITELTQFRDLRTKFYDSGNYGNILMDMPVSDRCQNLPNWAWNKAYSIKTDICIIVYSHSNCAGSSFRVNRGNTASLPYFRDDVDSYKPCNAKDVLKDFRLTVKIFKFEAAKGTVTTPRENSLDMGATQVFRNNGSGTISQRYSVSKQVTEIVEMERVVGSSEFHRFYVDAAVSYNFKAGIPGIAQTKISASLKTGYSFEKYSSETVSTRYRSETFKAFQVDQTINVPPCTVYNLASVVKLSSNYPVDYIAHAHVTGEYTGHRLNSGEIRSRLGSDMTYVRATDGYTVEVKFTKTLKADFGLHTEIHADGRPIQGCSSRA